MTGKRMKKLLMSKGINRNDAEYARLYFWVYSGGIMWPNDKRYYLALMCFKAAK